MEASSWPMEAGASEAANEEAQWRIREERKRLRSDWPPQGFWPSKALWRTASTMFVGCLFDVAID